MLPIPDVTLHPEDSRAHMRLAERRTVQPASSLSESILRLGRVASRPCALGGRACPRRRTIRPERLPVIDLLIVSHRHPDHMTWPRSTGWPRLRGALSAGPGDRRKAERESFLNKGESG